MRTVVIQLEFDLAQIRHQQYCCLLHYANQLFAVGLSRTLRRMHTLRCFEHSLAWSWSLDCSPMFQRWRIKTVLSDRQIDTMKTRPDTRLIRSHSRLTGGSVANWLIRLLARAVVPGNVVKAKLYRWTDGPSDQQSVHETKKALKICLWTIYCPFFFSLSWWTLSWCNVGTKLRPNKSTYMISEHGRN